MKPGPNLTRKLDLQDPQPVPDGAGGYSENWVTLGALWAEVTPGSGAVRAQEVIQISRVLYRITVHGAPIGAPSRPRPEQRFRDGSRVFHILAVTEADAQARYLTCFCEEEVSA